jgi:hypothetical protein
MSLETIAQRSCFIEEGIELTIIAMNQVVCRCRAHSTNSVLLLCPAGALPLHFLISQTQEFVGSLGRIVTDGTSNPAIDGQWTVSIDAERLKLLPDAVNDDFPPVLVTCVLGVVNYQIGIFKKLDVALVTGMMKGWPP